MNCPHCGANLEVTLTLIAGDVKPPEGFTGNTAGAPEMGALLSVIDVTKLEEGEAKFVSEQRERYDKYGDRTRISPKQLGWLRNLAKKAPKRPQGPATPASDEYVPF